MCNVFAKRCCIFAPESNICNMEEEQLKKENPWLKVADMYSPDKMDCLYGENNYFCEGDRVAIENYNKKASGTTDEIITKIPAEPWWGNPLKARLIILSLNPGYLPEVNKTLALLMQTNETVRRQLIEYKAKTLRLEAESFMPEEENDVDCPISCRDAVNMLGDWYWYKMLRHLKEEVIRRTPNIKEDDFYKRIALIEYHAYSSITSQRAFPLRNKFLESQIFTKKLIWYISQKEDTRILIMRSKDKWKKLLDDDNPGFYDDNVGKKILFKKNKGMSQAITANNLGEIIFKDIANLLAK